MRVAAGMASVGSQPTRAPTLRRNPISLGRSERTTPPQDPCVDKHSLPKRFKKRPSTRLRARRVDSPILSPVVQLGREAEVRSLVEMNPRWGQGVYMKDVLDLYSYLLRNRIVFLGGFVDFEMATKIVGSILALEALDDGEDIKLYINSPGSTASMPQSACTCRLEYSGGSIYAVLGVVDVIRACKANISTVAFGITGGNASLILASGTKGKRFAMPSSRILLQQPAGYIAGSSVEVSITATELDRSLQVITHLYSEFTGRSIEQMEMETNRENFLSPQEACELGVIDAVV